MAVNHSRSQRRSLLDGTTDGKYRKVRPDTEVVPGMGNEKTINTRAHLHPPFNYGFITEQTPPSAQVSPGT